MTARHPQGPSARKSAFTAIGRVSSSLPARTALGWSVALGLDHRGMRELDPGTLAQIGAALDAQAFEILAQVVSPVSVDEDLVHFRIALRRLARCGDAAAELRERLVQVPFVYDLRTHHWSDGALTAGEGMLAFLSWHAEAALGRELPPSPGEREVEIARRALAALGLATLVAARHPRGTMSSGRAA